MLEDELIEIEYCEVGTIVLELVRSDAIVDESLAELDDEIACDDTLADDTNAELDVGLVDNISVLNAEDLVSAESVTEDDSWLVELDPAISVNYERKILT